MTTYGDEGLLRSPGDPQRVTFLELFFDLAFVVALFQLSHGLIQDLRWRGAFHTLVLLLAVWFIWYGTAWLTDRLDPRRPPVQVVVIATLIGSLVIAAALPEAFGRRGLVFAGAIVALQIGRLLLLKLALHSHELQRDLIRPLFWSGVSAVPWIAGALTHDTARSALWTLALAVDYTAFALGFPVPGRVRQPTSESPIAAEHLAERYRQFLIIALGELILVTGLAFSGSGFALDQNAAFVVSSATTVLFWRIYIYRAGELLSAAIATVAKPARLAESASYAHLLMVAGIVVTAVGAQLVITHPLGHTRPASVTVILGGPAFFLLGRAIFEYTVFARVSRNRWIGLLLMAGLAAPMLHAPPLIMALAAAIVLSGIAAWDAARARRRPPETPSPPGRRR
jgi:low temperature requirement protein LtrA